MHARAQLCSAKALGRRRGRETVLPANVLEPPAELLPWVIAPSENLKPCQPLRHDANTETHKQRLIRGLPWRSSG